MATIDGGYALIYANATSVIDNSNLLSIRGSIYANFITYDNTLQDRTILLYTFSNNVTFNGIFCDIVSVGAGQVCTLSINSTIANNITTQYIRIYFLTSGSVLNVYVLSDLDIPNITSITSNNWVVNSMPYGGYILHNFDINGTTYIFAYDEYNIQTPLVSTLSSNQTVPINNFSTTHYVFGANVIMNNNTFLLPTLNTNKDQTSWSFINIPLPKVLEYRDHGYGNLEIDQVSPSVNSSVDSSLTNLNISFFDPIVLSTDPIPGSLTIYKASDNTIRQKISPLMSEFCSTSPDGKTITINFISSTFNEYNENYYVQMDNNFVKSSVYNEPLQGISDGIWNLTSNNMNNLINSSDIAIVGTVGLTKDAMKNFLSFSKSDRSNYFAQLLNEVAEKIPVRRERLTTNEKFQHINHGQQIIFSIKVDLPSSDSNENTADSVVSDLNTMLIYKQATTFLNGITNDLDNIYGFVIMGDFWADNATLIAVSILILVVIMFLYIPTKEQEEKMVEEIVGDAKKNLIGKIDKKVEEFSDDIKNEIIYEKDKLLENIKDDRKKKIMDKIFKKVADFIKNKIINEKNKILEKVGEVDILKEFCGHMFKAFSDIKKNIDGNKEKKFKGVVGDIKTELEETVVIIKAKLKKVAKKVLDKIVKEVNGEIKSNIVEMLKEEIIDKLVKKFVNKIEKKIIDKKEELLNNFNNDAAKKIIDERFKKISDGIRNKIINEADKMLTKVLEKVDSDMFKAIGDMFKNVGYKSKKYIDIKSKKDIDIKSEKDIDIKKKISEFLKEDIKEKFSKILEEVVGDSKKIVEEIGDETKKIIDEKEIIKEIYGETENIIDEMLNGILEKEIFEEKNRILMEVSDCIKTIIDEKLKGVGDDTKKIIDDILEKVGGDIKKTIDTMFEKKIIGIKVKTIYEFFDEVYKKIFRSTNEENGEKNEVADDTDNYPRPFSIVSLIRIPDENDSDEKDSDEKVSDEKVSGQLSYDDTNEKKNKFGEYINERVVKILEDIENTLDRVDSNQPLNDDTSVEQVKILEDTHDKKVSNKINSNQLSDEDMNEDKIIKK
ncbi:2227_t:CDS:2, partial [Dentiscutata heterogama]